MKKIAGLLLTIVWVGCVGGPWPTLASAEAVYVKYRGSVNLAPFACEWIARSSVVKRLCYAMGEKSTSS